MKPALASLVFAVVLIPAYCGVAGGEVFILASGGRVVGKLLNPKQSPREEYLIETSGGVRVTLAGSQVKQILHQQPAETEYETISPRYPDTIKGQWELAEWCRQRSLLPQRKKHLQRILELDPDHPKARAALGYSPSEGKWRTQEQVMLDRGYVRFGGRWRMPQEIELIKKQQEIEKIEKEWFKKVKLWRAWLGGDKSDQARQSLLAIDDPRAVEALAASLKDDPREAARIVYVEVLANIGTPEACLILAERSLEDPLQEVRLTCLDNLKEKTSPEVVDYYIGKLKSKDNRIVNLAAVGLRYMNDPSAVGPLIDALLTEHKFKVGKGSPGSMSQTFGTGPGGSGGPGGFSFGNSTRIVKIPLKNQSVLDALASLTKGVNFSYDVRAWKYWFAAQKKRPTLNARRN